MTTDREAAPHLAPIDRLARGEEPAAGTAPSSIPGRSKGGFVWQLFLYAVLMAVAVFYLLPFFWAVSTSFKTLPES